MSYLENHPTFTHRLEHAINHFKALNVVNLMSTANDVAGERPSVDDGPSICEVGGVVGGGLSLVLAPATLGASVIVGGLGWLSGVAGAAGAC